MSGKPFQGLVFCPTSLPLSVSDDICMKVTKLGGTYTKDLTRLVNVLVVGELFTAKYNFAVKNRTDIVFVDPACVDTLYDQWLSGQDLLQLARFDMFQYLQTAFTMGPFEPFNVFIGRIRSNEEYSLDTIVEMCEKGKAKSIDTAHFIRNASSSSSLFITDDLTGNRVQAALEENVPVVHPKWVVDCMDRSGTLDFQSFYLLQNCHDLEYSDIGSGAYIRNVLKKPVVPQSDVAALPHDDASSALKLAINKFKPQATQIWGRLLAKDPNNSKNGATSSKPDDRDTSSLRPESLGETTNTPTFLNCHFVFYQFDPRQVSILSKVIKGNKGTSSLYQETTPSAAQYAGNTIYYVCPSDFPTESLPQIPSRHEWLTEFFVERCLYYGQLLPPDFWSKPFYNEFRISPPKSLLHGESLSFHITGFHGVELLHINKIIDFLKLKGFSHHEKLTKKTDFLIVNISQLTSIPHEHALRQNKYASMFRTDLDMKISVKQAQMFRNSMKRKIEFVKKTHPIPIITPSFIIELFHRSMKPEKDFISIYFNDINWCISCPKGSKQDFELKIIPIQNEQQVPEEEKLESPESVRPPSTASSTASGLPHVPKRANRWGKLLSNNVDTENEESSLIQDDTNENDHLSHTQVTYGSASVSHSMKRRKISTRSQAKDIISNV
ncbi:unnamed protein product [Kluyveromyces dobzhanskii CBS 2104]|uniref:WGS project CCBQ000000000 data, contig 00010 n=1 Tax=Kluyveromyces dobzhanskii CBS 2104 TaxID=1427455 RepID=A0A0A8LCY3_9SACH|nr:unnamed protein product [Kluyveromyces dobzhanskii CBS 2104]